MAALRTLCICDISEKLQLCPCCIAARERALWLSRKPQWTIWRSQNWVRIALFLPPSHSWCPSLVGKPQGAADARAAVPRLHTRTILMEMAMVVWLNNGCGGCVHTCIMEMWRACVKEADSAGWELRVCSWINWMFWYLCQSKQDCVLWFPPPPFFNSPLGWISWCFPFCKTVCKSGCLHRPTKP